MDKIINQINIIINKTNYSIDNDYLHSYLKNSLELISQIYEESRIDIQNLIGKISLLILTAGIKSNCKFSNILNGMYKADFDNEIIFSLDSKIDCIDLIFEDLYKIYLSIKLYGNLTDEEIFDVFYKLNCISEFYDFSLEECIDVVITNNH